MARHIHDANPVIYAINFTKLHSNDKTQKHPLEAYISSSFIIFRISYFKIKTSHEIKSFDIQIIFYRITKLNQSSTERCSVNIYWNEWIKSRSQHTIFPHNSSYARVRNKIDPNTAIASMKFCMQQRMLTQLAKLKMFI